MNITEAFKVLDNLKFLKGYDNTEIGKKTVAQLLDEIADLLKDQERAIRILSDVVHEEGWDVNRLLETQEGI